MMEPTRPRVALYVSGSIAAYKACEVVTLLRKRGCAVRVAMTPAATRFVSAMTFQSLSGHPVATSPWGADAGAAEGADHGMAHIGLGLWAEVQVAVPASADLIARLANGLADDAVTTTALACAAPLVVAPAMETRMWRHPATVASVALLEARGATVVGPVSGRLASGHDGEGRMAEPVAVVEAVLAAAARGAGVADRDGTGAATAPVDVTGAGEAGRWLEGAHVLVTAGGTREPIDPVRYVGNRSSGKMGLELALEAERLGARVTLVTAAARLDLSGRRIDVIEVATAAGMRDAVHRALPGAAVLVMAAAVADYRPAQAADHKIKKQPGALTLELVRTVDVLADLRDVEARRGVFVVGFAAETDDLVANARRKLTEKGLDLIVANDIGDPSIGMGSDHNAVSILDPDGGRVDVGPLPKREVARRIFEVVRARRAHGGAAAG